MSELEQIREALDLTLEDFGRLLGTKSHSTVHRWENSPSMPSSKKALEKAKELYKKRKGKPWEAPAASGLGVTREEFADLKAALKAHVEYWQAGERRALERLAELDQRVGRIEKRIGASD